MAIPRNPNNPNLALNTTRTPVPNEIRAAINTANQCALDIDQLWPMVKQLQEKVNVLEEAAIATAKPTSKKGKGSAKKSAKSLTDNVKNVTVKEETNE